MKKIDVETLQAIQSLRQIIHSARSRCYNPANPEFPRYGARGITLCDYWLRSSDYFIVWAINEGGYKPGYYLDRKDNDKPYDPDNCRFVTAHESTKNRSNTRRATFNGRTRTIMEWAVEFGLTYKCLLQRIDKGETWPDVARPSAKAAKVPCSIAAKKQRPLKRGRR